MCDLPACLRHVTTGSGNPRARQWSARLPPSATLVLLGSTTQVGGTAQTSQSYESNSSVIIITGVHSIFLGCNTNTAPQTNILKHCSPTTTK